MLPVADSRQFIEYENLVQRIRKDVDADSNVSKAEIERLKHDMRGLENDTRQAQQQLDTECTKNKNLSIQNMLLRSRTVKLGQTMGQTNKAQEQKIKELETEVRESREFKQKVKGLF